MDHISEHVNYSNHKIHSHGQMRKMVVNLGSNKGVKTETPHANSAVCIIRY